MRPKMSFTITMTQSKKYFQSYYLIFAYIILFIGMAIFFFHLKPVDLSLEKQEAPPKFESIEELMLKEFLYDDLEYAKIPTDGSICYALYSSNVPYLQFVTIDYIDGYYFIKEQSEKIGFREDSGIIAPLSGTFNPGKIKFVFSPFEANEYYEYQKVEFSNAILYTLFEDDLE